MSSETPDQSHRSHDNWEVQKRSLPANKIALIDEIAHNLTLSDQTKGFLTRLLPNKLERIRKLSNEKLLSSELEAREEMFRMLCDTRKQAAEENYREILVRGKALLRRNTAEDFARQLKDLSEKLSEIVDQYNTDTTKAMEKAQSQSVPMLKAATTRRLESTTGRFFRSIDMLEEEFAKILDEMKSTPTK